MENYIKRRASDPRFRDAPVRMNAPTLVRQHSTFKENPFMEKMKRDDSSSESSGSESDGGSPKKKKVKKKKKAPDSPCWDGYHRTPGTKPYTKGSCEKD